MASILCSLHLHLDRRRLVGEIFYLVRVEMRNLEFPWTAELGTVSKRNYVWLDYCIEIRASIVSRLGHMPRI